MQTTIAGDSTATRVLGLILVPVDGEYVRRLQRIGKRAHGLSARMVAAKFGVTRATFKAWQTGKKRINAGHAQRARSLYAEWVGDVRDDVARMKSETRGVIRLTLVNGCDARMRELKVYRKPRLCRVCKRWFEPHQSRQARCSECAVLHRTVPRSRRRKGAR